MVFVDKRVHPQIHLALPHPVITLNLFQGPFIHASSGYAARWTLKRVQGDGVLVDKVWVVGKLPQQPLNILLKRFRRHRRRITAHNLPVLIHQKFSEIPLDSAAAKQA